MEKLLIDTLKQEVVALRKELELLEQRAVAVQSILDRTQERIAQMEEAQSALLSEEPTVGFVTPQENEEPEIEVELIVCEDDDVEEEQWMPQVQMKDDESVEEVSADEMTTEETESESAIALTEEISETPIATPISKEPTTGNSILPPVDDIRKAISLGDRFLFQRELFGGDGEKMNKTIDTLNKQVSFDEAMQFIGKKFAWDKESPAYELFMSILKRRFS
ncbi:MAG: hypothetical protein NC038_07460 [Paludibacter sp.]|nr:hypothetical protein [Bacteroidales bacterium]MCM1069736.1 hypothetical protein [Prevotella sp.]MCM1354421.1 hypothetical protein [Bacteroides sp.]MCM1443241.1 hypothetical protein [Muribaculum sp.]MCM1482455.1 hypothetical protein [Paludibacter sp.]